MATFVWPFLQALPKVSQIITLIFFPVLCSIFFLMSLEVLSGSSGRRRAEPSSIFDLSIPAFAHIKPCLVFAITVSPLFLIICNDSLLITSSISSLLISIFLPSTLEIIF